MSAARTPEPGPPTLRVVQIVPRDAARRLGRAVRELDRALHTLGVQVTLISDDPILVSACDDGPIRARGIAAPGGWFRRWRARQLARLNLDVPDVVHVWGLEALDAARQWAAALARPLLVHLTGWDELEPWLRSAPDPQTPVAALSERLAEAWQEAGLPRPAVILPAAAAGDAPDTPVPRQRTCGITCIGPIGATARLLLQAFARLRENQMDFHAVLLTAGSDRTLWRQVREAQLAHHVSVLDRAEMIEPAALGADILIVPGTERQMTGWPLLAMARRSLVLAPRTQLAEWFIEDRTCAGFDTADPTELTLLLTRALGRQNDLLRITASAADYVRQHHDPTAIAGQLAELYGSLAGRSAGRTETTRP